MDLRHLLASYDLTAFRPSSQQLNSETDSPELSTQAATSLNGENPLICDRGLAFTLHTIEAGGLIKRLTPTNMAETISRSSSKDGI